MNGRSFCIIFAFLQLSTSWGNVAVVHQIANVNNPFLIIFRDGADVGIGAGDGVMSL